MDDIRQKLESRKKESVLKELYLKNIDSVKDDIKVAIKRDLNIIQAINSIKDLDKAINMLSKRLIEWYGYYFPEISENSNIIELILHNDRDSLMKELGIKKTMGCHLEDKDIFAIKIFAGHIKSMTEYREELKNYLEDIMEELAPNVNHIAGTLIGAKLIELAGTLEKLSKFPASTIQILGAEKALFRHMRSGAKPPKYGVIFNHPLILKAKEKGRAARMLADKLSIAAKVDFFKGDFVADELLKDLEEKAK